MSNYYGYEISEEVSEFIQGMTDYVETNFGFAIESSEHHIYIDPIEDYVEVKFDKNTVFKYSNLREFLLNHELNGKKIIELLEDFDFA